MASLGPFDRDRRIVAAVSGGADSMALAVLLAGWGRPLACIVDHRLRPDSAAEAEQAAARLSAAGVPSRIVRACIPPGTGLADRARRARYALLSQACTESGCPDLVTAHHRRDQAETWHLRRAAGSGLAGLAGMACVSYADSVRLLRPLLGLPPERLRATLVDHGIAWSEDPSNADLRTPRARLRLTMTAAGMQAAAAAADRAGRERQQAERSLAAELSQVSIRAEGYAVAPPGLGLAALAAIVWCVSGRDYPPGNVRWAACTVHGVVIRPAGRLGSGWLLAREPAAMQARVPAVPGAVWDGRFILPAGLPGGTIGALGAESMRFRFRNGLPATVLQGLPALRIGGELHAVPHLAFPDAETCRSVHPRFAPRHGLAGAPFAPSASASGRDVAAAWG